MMVFKTKLGESMLAAALLAFVATGCSQTDDSEGSQRQSEYAAADTTIRSVGGAGGNPSDDTSVQDGINEGSDVGETDESTAEAEDLD